MRIKLKGSDSLARLQRASASYNWRQFDRHLNPGGAVRDALVNGRLIPTFHVGVSSLGNLGVSRGGVIYLLVDVGESDYFLGVSDPELIGAAVGESFAVTEQARGWI